MKKTKTFLIITFFFFLFSESVIAQKRTKVKVNQTISGEVCYKGKRNCYTLEEGEYIVYAKQGEGGYFGYDIFESARVENNQIIAFDSGYIKSRTAIIDANITTLIAALILYIIGTGPVKGFAITLSIGIVTSMFTAIMCTRAMVNIVYGNKNISELKI